MFKKLAGTVVMLLCVGGSVYAAGGVGLYGFRWDGNEAGTGHGGGILVKSDFAAFGGANLRLGYGEFDDIKTDITPMELGFRLQLPFFIQPYAGVGGGYYITDADLGTVSDAWGWFAEGGVEIHFLVTCNMVIL